MDWSSLISPELISVVSTALLTAILGGVGIVMPRAFSWLKIDRNSKLAELLETAVRAGIQYAFSRIPRASLANVVTDPGIKGEVIARASEYVDAQIPDAIKKLGIDSTAVRRIVESRVVPALADMARQHLMIAETAPGPDKLAVTQGVSK